MRFQQEINKQCDPCQGHGHTPRRKHPCQDSLGPADWGWQRWQNPWWQEVLGQGGL